MLGRKGLGWRKYVLGLPLGVVGAALALAAGLDTPMGHRLIADVLEATDLGNGLRIGVGRIEGSIYGRARLEGVVFHDPRGVFLRSPQAVLDWRPLEWFSRGLVIHELTVKRGTLLRLPQLRAGDPKASLWPDFDIAVDRLAIERLTVGKAVLGSERRVDVSGHLRLVAGEAALGLNGRLGGADRLSVAFEASRKADRFDLNVDYHAPKGGLLAALSGAQVDRSLRIGGKGRWQDWQGWALGEQGGKRALALRLTQRAGHVGLLGRVWNHPMPGDVAKALGGASVAVSGEGDVAERAVRGRLALGAENLRVVARGGVDLGRARLDGVELALTGGARLPLGDDDRLAGLRARVRLDGAFGAMRASYSARAESWTNNGTRFVGMQAEGSARADRGVWRAPVKLAAGAIVTEDGTFDEQLRHVSASATLVLAGGRVRADDMALAIPKGQARAVLQGDVARGTYVVSGEAALRGWPLAVGAADARGAVRVQIARGQPWRVSVMAAGVVPKVSNGTLAALSGGAVRFSGRVEVAKGHQLSIAEGRIEAPKLSMSLSGARGADLRLALSARGQQRQYGSFGADISYGEDGPRGTAHFDDPLPAAGIKDVALVLTPEADALRIEARGQSGLGPFAGTLGVVLPDGGQKAGGKARLDVRDLALSATHVRGVLALGDEGAEGRLNVSGGGVSGAITLAPGAGGQNIEAMLGARNAHFEGDKPLTIAVGRLQASGAIQKGHTSLSADLSAQGIGKGKLFVGSLALGVALKDGVGKVTGAIGGRKGSRFDVRASGDVTPDRIALVAGGSYAGQAIAMPRRAVLTAERREDGSVSGWRLAQSQIDFGGGRVLAQGVIGNGSLELGIGLVDMPLSLADVVLADVGLGGKASGRLTYVQRREHLPEGEARIMLRGLTRSGLVLTSRPVDVAVVGRLGPGALDLRAVARENGQTRGRLQARIDQLGDKGLVADRLRLGRLVAQMRYDGPADALWRLMALDSFDLTGPVELAANMTGTLENPEIQGSLASNALRLQSAQAGTDITGIVAHGAFGGSMLTLSNLSGHTAGGGVVSGSGRVDFARMENGRGPGIDITLAAKRAQLLARQDIALTGSGPIRVISDGVTGTIAGRLAIDSARFRLGKASAAAELPAIATTEINRRADIAPASDHDMPWRLMVDASGGGIRVQGLGLDSLWNADIKLRGGLLEPTITGAANMVEGTYDFASKHFEMTRGRISFDGNSPPNPRLDMAATATVNSLTATVSVRGTSLKPEIAFTSVPALPEEELLARILFGDSITQISAPEALQLGAALAALHGGGGLDPINKLRTAIGLDRLRFVSADAALGRQTGVAVGKYLGRHFYAELVSDGRGYSATNLEFRLSSWLALLGSVASTGRQSVNAKVSRDY